MPDVPDSADARDLRSAGSAVADPPATAQSPGESVTDPVTAAADVLPIAAQPLGQPAPPPMTAVQLALYAGWTMAVLYGRIQAPPADDITELPTTHELQPDQRRTLELKRLRHLLLQLASQPETAGSGLPTNVPADDASEKTLRDRLPALNLAILEALAVTLPEVELAYELGRSLRDTANPPPEREEPHAPALARQLGRGRIAKLQEWLGTLSAQFPQHTAAIVAASLGRWSEFAAVTIQKKPPLKRSADTDVAATMCDYLLPQGDLWLMLLTGARSTSGLLSPEGYVAAGELALHRSAAIVRQVIRRYAVELLIVAAALGFIIFLAVNNLGGAARVWTTIAAIGGSLGISGQTIASASSRLTSEAERPVFTMAEEDAMAWAITTLPVVGLTSRATQRLRRAGVGPKESLGRV
jgi:hypothetical protein